MSDSPQVKQNFLANKPVLRVVSRVAEKGKT